MLKKQSSVVLSGRQDRYALASMSSSILLSILLMLQSKRPYMTSLLLGDCSQIFPDKESMIAGAIETAVEISSKSPVAVQSTKLNLVYSRDHSVPESLSFIVSVDDKLQVH